MMSKHCLFKVIKEDLRHKIWMLALSMVGSLMALPVFYLLMTGGKSKADTDYYQLLRYVDSIREFFQGQFLVSCGIVAFAGALIVGLFGFRYVFHKNMVDTWHSIPVKRRTLFLAGWLNGFMIWFVPFILMLAVTMIMGIPKYANLRNRIFTAGIAEQYLRYINLDELISVSGLIKDICASIGILIIVFFLVYNLTLVAVMLCGNVLNTMVTTAVLGAGVISMYGTILVLCESYWNTYSVVSTELLEKISYASPLVSSVYLLALKVGASAKTIALGKLVGSALFDLAVAICLGILAGWIYGRRKSELAEQGLKDKVVCFCIRTIVALTAAVGGWIMFALVACGLFGSGSEIAWGIFGALFIGALAFGIMDIVFYMDFKAFLEHKLMMCGTVLAGIIVCLSFYGDWFGYDTYLPDKDSIAQISIYDFNASNIRYYHPYDESTFDLVKIEDSDLIYDFLKTATDEQKKISSNRNTYTENVLISEEEYVERRSNTVNTKVTLKNGRSYFREYTVYSDASDAYYNLISTDEYCESYYVIPEADIQEFSSIIVERTTNSWESTGMMLEDEFRAFCHDLVQAFNKDLKENKDVVLKGDTRLLCNVVLESRGYTYDRNLPIYDGMTNCIETLQRYGLEEYTCSMDFSDVKQIELNTYYWYDETTLMQEHEFMKIAARQYGVYPEIKTQGAESEQEKPIALNETNAMVTEEDSIKVLITDPEEIQEILNLLSYSYHHYQSVFSNTYVDSVMIYYGENNMQMYCSIQGGTLPEKYIYRFDDLQNEIIKNMK